MKSKYNQMTAKEFFEGLPEDIAIQMLREKLKPEKRTTTQVGLWMVSHIYIEPTNETKNKS